MNLRIAISGSACTGKSTLAAALAQLLELPLIPEAMRRHLEAGNPRLDTLPRIQTCAVLDGFRTELAREEQRCGAFVADNGMLDLLAYARWYGCSALPEPWEHRYDAVILLPAGVLPYEADGVRQSDPGVERRFQALVERLAAESLLGSRLFTMPKDLLTVSQRAEWVFQQLRQATLRAL